MEVAAPCGAIPSVDVMPCVSKIPNYDDCGVDVRDPGAAPTKAVQLLQFLMLSLLEDTPTLHSSTAIFLLRKHVQSRIHLLLER